MARSRSGEATIDVFVELVRGVDAADANKILTEAGFVVEEQIGNRYIGRVTPSKVEALRALSIVRIVEPSCRMKPHK